jgi:hypothetical protein
MWVIPDLGIWGIFLQGEKFWCQIFAVESTFFVDCTEISHMGYVLPPKMLTMATAFLLTLVPWE